MKRNKIAYSAAALALTLLASGCEEQIMEWKPGDPTVEISEIPLQLQEQIMLYKPIKDYVAQYHPHLNLAIGIGADMYLSDPDYKAVVDENFTGITLGNAMKMGVLMKSNGTLDFTTVDKVLASLPQGMKFYGHNLLWHTQQQQAYLKSLIAPQMVLPLQATAALPTSSQTLTSKTAHEPAGPATEATTP
ncbi:endo-1,4-beta-xylanase [Duncaniella sp. C9]|uniref:endo-1,4-beta-xylanase n=1 Tax=Duncaniella sp. C9 TaxID=2530392 RepID=UPI001F11471D|nr:endo-1,4-beta-xylanase [Duncaniella sp. C9]